MFGSSNDFSASNHNLNQCWILGNWTRGNRLQSDMSENEIIFKDLYLICGLPDDGLFVSLSMI